MKIFRFTTNKVHLFTRPIPLKKFKISQKNPGLLLTGNGAPIANKNASLTVGPRGPLLMQDFVFMDDISHVTLERIPERVVHARGSGEYRMVNKKSSKLTV